eukprot:TRINITY_DN68716_c0_g2_i4.p1 TRINITY_DN68716_c0_g2~~TRINITY_DN68716_c0_g2_i4.p1  ORF type:complete len:464 (-),score=46.77 TRINITY_DN68716_c0_g2_i4:339-1730(-)
MMKVLKRRLAQLEEQQHNNVNLQQDSITSTQDLQLKPQQFPKKRKAFLAAPNPRGQTPEIDGVIVVEGISDCFAVSRAVYTPIFVFGGGGSNREFIEQLKQVCERVENVIVLADPDTKGRQLRDFIDENIGPVLHAFVPMESCLARRDTKYHKVGNIGIEHASQRAILFAVNQAQLSDPSRKEFTRDDLEEWNLVGKVGGDEGPLRRSIFCNLLGTGKCNGKQLLRQLNRYGFNKTQIMDTLHRTDDRQERVVQLWKSIQDQGRIITNPDEIDIQLYLNDIGVRYNDNNINRSIQSDTQIFQGKDKRESGQNINQEIEIQESLYKDQALNDINEEDRERRRGQEFLRKLNKAQIDNLGTRKGKQLDVQDSRQNQKNQKKEYQKLVAGVSAVLSQQTDLDIVQDVQITELESNKRNNDQEDDKTSKLESGKQDNEQQEIEQTPSPLKIYSEQELVSEISSKLQL